jgi:alpha-L-rhamnosidase
MVNWEFPVLPSPLFRLEFKVESAVRSARAMICGLGYYELYLNGQKVGDQVLDPVVTQYDRRVRYVTHRVEDCLQPGVNAVGVMLGNGWYNCSTPDVWHFDKASWRDYPKLLLQIEIVFKDGRKVTIGSGPQWKVADGPLRFDSLRNGETYDARLEKAGWISAGYDDSDWSPVAVVPGPGGLLEEQLAPPCKVMETLVPRTVHEVKPGVALFDFGRNIAGWARLRVKGAAGTEVCLRYGERLNADGTIDQKHIGAYIKGGDCQTDHYILTGGGEEVWEPRFTYHGFQYVQVEGLPGTPSLDTLRGRVVHTAFEKIGSFACSNEDLNRLQECTLASYRGNFVGIPTDCPHREKNGWTGDAQLAAETGLMNFDAAPAYREWIATMADTQRPNGQFPGIVPSTGWGYNWGSGPAWDSAFILIPWYITLYTGDTHCIEQHYEAMKRYVDYCTSLATGGIMSFGLGDWCHVDSKRMVTAELPVTAFYYTDALLISRFAGLTNRPKDQRAYTRLAAGIREAFNRKFYKGDGVYAAGEQTAMGVALHYGLVDEGEKARVVARLAEAVIVNQCRPDFGILGAKTVPRVLAENGHADLAYRLITQPEFPGWVHWLRQGATTLWEDWNGESSRNHIMFGDISAWMYSYLAGIKPDPDVPGFKRFTVSPCFPEGLDWVKAEHATPRGLIKVSWKRNSRGISMDLSVPSGSVATLRLPGGVKLQSQQELFKFAGSHFTAPLKAGGYKVRFSNGS